MSDRTVLEDGRELWLLDEPAADATWDPARGVLVVHLAGGEDPRHWRARSDHPAHESAAGTRVELPPHSALADVREAVAAIGEGDAWRDRGCWVCGADQAALSRAIPGVTMRVCEPCGLLVAEQDALSPPAFRSGADDGTSAGLWGEIDGAAFAADLAGLEGWRPLRRVAGLLVVSTVPTLALPLWPAYAGSWTVVVAGLWALTAASLWSGPPWLPWVAGSLVAMVHVMQWALASGSLRSARRPGRPRKVMPDLFKIAERAWVAVGEAPVDRIELVDDLLVQAHDAVYDDGPTRVMSVGRAALAVLGPDELEVLMANALACAGERARGALLADAWTERWHLMLHLAQERRGGGLLGRFARWVVPRWLVARAALYRLEVPRADARTGAAYGPQRVGDVLLRQAILQEVLYWAFFRAARRWFQEGWAHTPQFEAVLREGLASLEDRYLQRLAAAAQWRRAPWWESRPSVGERLAALGITPGPVNVGVSDAALPLRQDAGLDRLDGWLLQAFRGWSLQFARARTLLAASPIDGVAPTMLRAQLAEFVDDVPSALATLDQVLIEAPDHALAHRARLQLLFAHGEPEAMVAAATDAVAHCTDAEALEVAAEILRQLGRVKAAIEAARRGAEVTASVAVRSRLLTEVLPRLQGQFSTGLASSG